MGFLSLLEVASMPILQVLLISGLGAFLATDYSNLLSLQSRSSLNKIVFIVFTPCLIFASLAKTVTFEDIISWWFMPVNIGFTFLFGGILGWVLVKLIQPKPYLEGLIIATCSSGNMGNLPLMIVPAICNEEGSPFGSRGACRSVGLSYASFSMALGGFYIWTYTYNLMRTSSLKWTARETPCVIESPNQDLEATQQTRLLIDHDANAKSIVQAVSTEKEKVSLWRNTYEFVGHILEELMAPPTLGAIIGLIFGATTWLRNLIIGESAPLRAIQDSIQLLGDATIPCITLILGGNLVQGLKSSAVRPLVIIGVVCIRYLLLPCIGIGIVKTASSLGFLPPDHLFTYVLMIQYTLPPAMSIATMAQLFDVGQEECSVIFMWTYLVAALAITLWSTVFMSIL